MGLGADVGRVVTVLITEYVGRRVIAALKNSPWGEDDVYDEYRVLEVSPSGNFVRLLTCFGRKFWRPVTDVALIEALKPFEPHPPQEKP